MVITNIIAFILVLLGSLIWGLVGIFNWNPVTAIFGPGMNVGSSIIYILVFLASLWLIFSAIYSRGKIDMEATQLTKPNKKDDRQI
jgi:uncharacterized membrane protein YuzA (DUF378 family)